MICICNLLPTAVSTLGVDVQIESLFSLFGSLIASSKHRGSA